MKVAAQNLEFEEAGHLRERIKETAQKAWWAVPLTVEITQKSSASNA